MKNRSSIARFFIPELRDCQTDTFDEMIGRFGCNWFVEEEEKKEENGDDNYLYLLWCAVITVLLNFISRGSIEKPTRRNFVSERM